MDEYEGDRPSRLDALAIKFNAFDDGFQKPTTRAGVMEDFSVDDKVSVLSMMSPDRTNWSNVFTNDAAVEITNVGEYLWSYTNKQKWTDGNTYKFRGFYPSSASGFNETAGETCTDGYTWTTPVNGTTKLTLTDYRAANDPRNNTDLMVSDVVERTYSKSTGNDDPVELKMNHLLACVNFNIRKVEGKKLTISSFRIEDVVNKGNCTIGNNIDWTLQKEYDGKTYNIADISDQFEIYDDKGVLLNPSGSKDITQIPGQLKKHTGLSIIIKTEDKVSGDGDIFQSDAISESYLSNFLFIPQPLNGYVEKIKIKGSNGQFLVDKNNNQEFTIKHEVSVLLEYQYEGDTKHNAVVNLLVPGKVESWEPGKKYNYTIGIYEYQATANITIEDWTHHTYEEELK